MATLARPVEECSEEWYSGSPSSKRKEMDEGSSIPSARNGVVKEAVSASFQELPLPGPTIYFPRFLLHHDLSLSATATSTPTSTPGNNTPPESEPESASSSASSSCHCGLNPCPTPPTIPNPTNNLPTGTIHFPLPLPRNPDLCFLPGKIHGGFLAALLDDFVARCCFPSVTKSLKIQYLKSIPPGADIVLKARAVKVEGGGGRGGGKGRGRRRITWVASIEVDPTSTSTSIWTATGTGTQERDKAADNVMVQAEIVLVALDSDSDSNSNSNCDVNVNGTGSVSRSGVRVPMTMFHLSVNK